MRFVINAACVSDTGRIRKNNEDNFYFCGRCLPAIHSGTRNILHFERNLRCREIMAVFDGMGGENFGEEASYAAALQMKRKCCSVLGLLKNGKEFVSACIESLNNAVVKKKKEYATDRMGTTLTMASFWEKGVWIGNLGDSRAYRLRGRKLEQLTIDHVVSVTSAHRRKAPLTQYLGIDPEELLIEPHIAYFSLKDGDRFVLCSDGLTDMLTENEISTLMQQHADSASCAQALADAANEHGGRDNITVIVCSITEREGRYGR